jgi:uncharacterized protein
VSGRRTFVLVDGENIDATLGNSLLGRRPLPEERPRWERVTAYAGRSDQKVVDVGIQRTLDALLGRDDDVLLVSHDADFAPHMQRLLGTERRIGVVGLHEYVSIQYTDLDIEIHDLEDDVQAFNVPLPRVRIIDLDDFDPERFLR